MFLPSDFMTSDYGNKYQYVAHELGHIWDMNAGHGNPLGPFAGGPGDMLNAAIGGNVESSLAIRWLGGGGSARYIGEEWHFEYRVRYGYGNGTTADYLAEAFGWRLYDPSNLPRPYVGSVIDVLVNYESLFLP